MPLVPEDHCLRALGTWNGPVWVTEMAVVGCIAVSRTECWSYVIELWHLKHERNRLPCPPGERGTFRLTARLSHGCDWSGSGRGGRGGKENCSGPAADAPRVFLEGFSGRCSVPWRGRGEVTGSHAPHCPPCKMRSSSERPFETRR